MASSRRQDAATALTGAALLGAGGGLRHAGVSQAVAGGKYPRVHLAALKGAGRGPKGLYLAGTGLGLVGAAGLSQGALGLVHRKGVDKADKQPLWREGVAGTGEALRNRAESIKTPTPPKVRASQWAIAGGAGAGGSAVARALLKHRTGKAKALLAPIAGGLAATASIPVSNRVVRRQTKGQYVVTATGVRRAKDVIKKPSSKARLVTSRNGPLRGQVVPNDDRFGKSTSYRQQRAAITAAGATPVVGPYAQAHLAGSYAPKGERHKNAVRQFAMGPAAGNVAGVGGAYGAAHLARHSAKVGAKAENAMAWRTKQTDRLRGKVGLKPARPAAEGTARHALRSVAEAHPLAKPLVHSRGTMAAAGLGFLASRAIVGTAGTQRAITLNQRDQSRARVGKGLVPLRALRSGAKASEAWKPPRGFEHSNARRIEEIKTSNSRRIDEIQTSNLAARDAAAARAKEGQRKLEEFRAKNNLWSHDTGAGRTLKPATVVPNPKVIGKALLESGQTKREKHTLARTKRTNAALAVTSGTLGLSSLGLLAARKKSLATSVGIVASGVGGTNSLIGARVQRREARNIDPVKKAGVPKKVLRFTGNEGVSRARATYPERSPGLADLHLPATDPVIWRKPHMARHDQALKIKRLNRMRTGKSSQRAFDNLELPRDTARHRGPINGQFGKGFNTLPMGNIPRHAIHASRGKVRVLEYHGNDRFTVLHKNERVIAHRNQLTFLPERKPKGGGSTPVTKNTGADDNDAIRRYGDRGPLPKGLAREEKIRAYQARVDAHGGHKRQKWQRRANVSEGARNVALATGTVALAGLAHLKTHRGAKTMLRHPDLHRKLDHLALASGAAGGAAELSGEYSRGRRASYSSSPGGVAQSALTRLKANTPGAT